MTEELKATESNEEQITNEQIEAGDLDSISQDVEEAEELESEGEEPTEEQVDEQIPDAEDIEEGEGETQESADLEEQQQAEETEQSESENQDGDEEDLSVEEGQAEVTTDHTPTLESAIEAVLFASDESLTAARLANIVEATTKQVRDHIKNLNEKYQANGSAFRIEQIAGGFQMLTLSCYNHWLKQLLRVRSETKLSPAAMETLAIIAYKQPVIRADIEAIRGVAVGEVIRSLRFKGLVKIVGRAEVLGRPMLYGTTKKFLEVFGLNTLKDLPKIEELKKPPN